MDKDFATSIGLNPKADGSSLRTIGVQIQFNNLTLQNVNTTTENLTEFAKSIGHTVPYILGDDLFNQLTVEIDFAHHRIAFHNPSAKIILAGAMEVPLIRNLDNRTVPVSVEGAPPAQFAFGLGNAAPLLVYQSYYQKYKLLLTRPTSLRQGGGGAGPFPSEPVATLNHVLFAGVSFSKLPAAFIPDSLSGVNSELISGNIGIAILSRFHFIIDYANDRLYAVPYDKAENTLFIKDRLGMVLIKKDTGFNVKFISPGSPAQAAGFKAGDTIMLIDQKSAQAWPDTAIANLRFLGIGTTLTFTMINGEVRRLSLADFF